MWLKSGTWTQYFDKTNPLVPILNDWKETTHARSLTFEDVVKFLASQKDYVVSIKIDGELTGLVYENGEAYTVSRVGRIRKNFPVTDEATTILQGHKKVIALGELYLVNDKGIPVSYPNAMSALRTGSDLDHVRFAVFDLYEVDDTPYFEKNYWDRFQGIEQLFKDGTYVSPIVAVKDGVPAVEKLWQEVVSGKGLEGLVITLLGEGIGTEKKIKVKPAFTQDLAVIGIDYNPDHQWMSNLVLAYIDAEDHFRYAGRVGTGFKEADRKEWAQFAESIKTDETKNTFWLDPTKTRVVQIRSDEVRIHDTPTYKFENGTYISIEASPSAVGRKPVFERIREDKKPNKTDVRLEQIPGFEMEKQSSNMADLLTVIQDWETTYGHIDNASELLEQANLEYDLGNLAPESLQYIVSNADKIVYMLQPRPQILSWLKQAYVLTPSDKDQLLQFVHDVINARIAMAPPSDFDRLVDFYAKVAYNAVFVTADLDTGQQIQRVPYNWVINEINSFIRDHAAQKPQQEFDFTKNAVKITDKELKKWFPIFVDKTDPPDHKCATCQSRIESEPPACAIVDGPISLPNGSCLYWAFNKQPTTAENAPSKKMDYMTSGYVVAPEQFTINCSTCFFFKDNGCALWQGAVKPEQCCMAYKNDKVPIPTKSSYLMDRLQRSTALQKRAELGEELTDNIITIYLVRHGSTPFNEQKRLRGWTDIPLSNLGEKQAEKTAELFEDIPLKRIYCSDFVRTQQTATPIEKVTGAELTPTKLLRPINFGDWNGELLTDIESKLFEIQHQWQTDPTILPPGDSENFETFQNRQVQVFEEILQKASAGDKLAIVAHLRNCVWIMAYILNGRKPLQGDQLNLLNNLTQEVGALSIISYSKDKNQVQLEKQNFTPELETEGTMEQKWLVTSKIKDKIPGGFAAGMSIEDIAKKYTETKGGTYEDWLEKLNKQLAMGVKVEMEHTHNEKVSAEIARDHLVEIPDYYDRLKEMEDTAEAQGKPGIPHAAALERSGQVTVEIEYSPTNEQLEDGEYVEDATGKKFNYVPIVLESWKYYPGEPATEGGPGTLPFAEQFTGYWADTNIPITPEEWASIEGFSPRNTATINDAIVEYEQRSREAMFTNQSDTVINIKELKVDDNAVVKFRERPEISEGETIIQKRKVEQEEKKKKHLLTTHTSQAVGGESHDVVVQTVSKASSGQPGSGSRLSLSETAMPQNTAQDGTRGTKGTTTSREVEKAASVVLDVPEVPPEWADAIELFLDVPNFDVVITGVGQVPLASFNVYRLGGDPLLARGTFNIKKTAVDLQFAADMMQTESLTAFHQLVSEFSKNDIKLNVTIPAHPYLTDAYVAFKKMVRDLAVASKHPEVEILDLLVSIYGTSARDVFEAVQKDFSLSPETIGPKLLPIFTQYGEGTLDTNQVTEQLSSLRTATLGFTLERTSYTPDHPGNIKIKSNYYPTGLSEQQIYDHWKSVESKLMPELQGFYVMTMVETDGHIIYKRNDKEGNPLQIKTADDYEKYIATGGTVSVHTILPQAQTKMGWVEIDPKDKVPFEKTKQVTQDIYDIVSDMSPVKDVWLRFSGSRGFHIIFTLQEPMDVQALHAALKETLSHYITQTGDSKITTGITKDVEGIRLDTSTLKYLGSIRAPYSINEKTGLVDIPISITDLASFQKETARIPLKPQFLQDKYLGTPLTSATVYSPENPRFWQELYGLSSKIDNQQRERTTIAAVVPKKGFTGKFVIQRHEAEQAGTHFDLRLEMPEGELSTYQTKRKFEETPEPKGASSKTVLASWAIPKAKLPDSGEKILAVQTEDHPMEYLHFKGTIPSGYGKGAMEIYDTGTWTVIESNPSKITFQLQGQMVQGEYTLVKTQGNRWLLVGTTMKQASRVGQPVQVKATGEKGTILYAQWMHQDTDMEELEYKVDTGDGTPTWYSADELTFLEPERQAAFPDVTRVLNLNADEIIELAEQRASGEALTDYVVEKLQQMLGPTAKGLSDQALMQNFYQVVKDLGYEDLVPPLPSPKQYVIDKTKDVLQ